MTRYLLATVSALALSSAAVAQETDSWTGPYIGLNGGVGWINTNVFVTQVPLVPSTPEQANLSAAGATFGGQIGYNWQMQGLVLGAEADINWVGARAFVSQPMPGGFPPNSTFTSNLHWLATIRGRVGMAMSPTLLYVTGGVAFGGLENTAVAFAGHTFTTGSETRTGWTAGGGIEHMFNPRWSMKAEVLYVDFGTRTVTDGQALGYTGRFRNNAVVGRVGVNLRW